MSHCEEPDETEPEAGVRSAAAEAVAMRPIPDEALHAGAEVTARIAIRRAAATPTEDECWSAFWQGTARAFAKLPPEIQQEYARRYPPGSNRAREDFGSGTRTEGDG